MVTFQNTQNYQRLLKTKKFLLNIHIYLQLSEPSRLQNHPESQNWSLIKFSRVGFEMIPIIQHHPK